MKMMFAAVLFAVTLADAAEPEPPLWAQMQRAVLQKKDITEVRRILDAGFDPNSSIGCGNWPPILGAVQEQDTEMAKLLIDRGAKVPDVVMVSACRTGNLDLTLVRLLVAHGGNVNASNEYETCLHSAIVHNNDVLVQYLVSCKGIDLNVVRRDGDKDGTPLMWALRTGEAKIARILLKAGADKNVKGELASPHQTFSKRG